MPNDEERSRDEFTGEAEELLDALSKDLSEFEAQGTNVRPELINQIFREVHTLKGLAGMFGIADIAELSHTLEDMLDLLRQCGERAYSKMLFERYADWSKVDDVIEAEIGLLGSPTSAANDTAAEAAAA